MSVLLRLESTLVEVYLLSFDTRRATCHEGVTGPPLTLSTLRDSLKEPPVHPPNLHNLNRFTRLNSELDHCPKGTDDVELLSTKVKPHNWDRDHPRFSLPPFYDRASKREPKQERAVTPTLSTTRDPSTWESAMEGR